jgi:O-antigen/teichoic acid export membrane protein
VVGSLVHTALLWFAVSRWGVLGAAVAVGVGFLIPLFFGVPMIHRRISALPSLFSMARELVGVASAVLATFVLIAFLLRVSDPGAGVAPLLGSLVGCMAAYLGFLLAFRGIRLEEIRSMFGGLASRFGAEGR